MNFGTETILDLLLAGLLCATLIYCFVLNRRLSKLRSARGDMAEMVRGFHQATEAARASVSELKHASDAIGMDLKNQVDKAREILDELELVSSSANRVADRIEKGVDQSKPAASPAASPASPERPAKSEVRSEAERELLNALREVR
jgi:hypothetical protein